MTGELPGPAPAERPQPSGRRDEHGARLEATNQQSPQSSRAVLSALVEHEPGVLAAVSGLFSRRQFNIESLTVGPTTESGRARMTIVVDEPENGVEQARKQLQKLLPVQSVEQLDDNATERELALVKVDADDPEAVNAVAEMYQGRAVDVSTNSVTVEVTGSEQKIDAAIAAFERFDVREVARTGTAAMERDSGTNK